ncbi:hypothetical protein D3C72_1384370 [compost metagenome]
MRVPPMVASYSVAQAASCSRVGRAQPPGGMTLSNSPATAVVTPITSPPGFSIQPPLLKLRRSSLVVAVSAR